MSKSSNISYGPSHNIWCSIETTTIGKTLSYLCFVVEPVKEEIETRREIRKASKEEESFAEAPKSSGSPKWDSTPQSIWLSDSIPETAVLKFKTNPKLDAENVLKQSKLHYTGRNFLYFPSHII